MRTLAMPIIVASLIAGAPVMAQAAPGSGPEKQTQQTQPQQPQQQQSVTIRSIQVVDVEDLQADMRSKVDALLANTKQEELQSLRASIDATPQAVSALKAKGRNSAQVVAINVDENGILTMFTKKTA
jgi:biopolymer transport protein ExbD